MANAGNGFAAMRQAELEGALIVAPDRARTEVNVTTVVEGNRAKASATLEDWVKRFESAVKRMPGCSTTVVHLSLPTKAGETNAQQAATLVVEMALQGVSSVSDRVQKVGRCAAVVADMMSPRSRSKRSRVGTFASARAWSLSVDQPQSHLATLLKRKSERFQAMRGLTLASQLKPEDRRCVPTGEVVTRMAAYAGIWLEAELLCDVVRSPHAQQNHTP